MTKNHENTFLKHFWRPALAWSYVAVVLFDFIIGPLLTMALSYITGATYVPWEPLTLKESGFYHIAMMPILGVSAWTRGQEKLQKLNSESAESEPEKK